MALARSIFSLAVTVSLAAYAFDCAPMATAQQAMQCCKSMQCMRHGHQGQDCCKTMPTIHSAIGQPTAVHGISYSPVAHGPVQAVGEFQSIESSPRLIAEHAHDPPSGCSPPVLSLRI